ncbi:Uncharacterised protein [Enterobacter cloacae]|nr:Uncharacterised protein [Enterobacter cloacae]
MRLFWRLAGDQYRIGSKLGKPGRVFLRFRELVTAYDKQQIAV